MSGLPTTPSPFDLQPLPVATKSPWWSTWEDVLDVYYAPSDVFARRRDGRYLGSWLLISVLSLLIMLLSAQVTEAITDLEFSKAMAKAAADGQKMTPEQVASMRAIGAKFASFGPYLVPIFVAVGAWVGGAILWLLTKMLGGRLTFAQSTMIALLSSVPEMIERALIGAQGLLMDTVTAVHKYSFHVSAARYLPGDADTWLMKAAAIADPFVIWGSVILGIGVYVLSNLEKEKAAVVAVLYTLILAIVFR